MGQSTTQQRANWQAFECKEHELKRIAFGPDEILVAPPTVDAWRALACVLAFHNYKIRPADTYSYNCRQITGGTGHSLHSYGIALDASGNAYVTGPTESAAFPTAGAYQGTRAGFGDAFVTKLNASGSALVYSTYLGGSRYESGSSIAVDAGGNAYVTGSTSSTDFPTASPYQAAAAGAGDAFVTKLNATGSALVYSTYVGGADIDIPYRIAVDSAGNAYVTGQTRSIDFPTENSYQSSLAGFYDAFVTKLNATGSALVYSTYLGGGASTSRRASPSMRARTRMSPGRRPRRTSRQRALSRRRTAAATTLS